MKYLPLLGELIQRDIKIKYRRSILGVLWTVLNPLLMMGILYVVFSKLFRFEIENYAIYILSGQIIFNYFQNSTTDAMMSIVGNAGLIRKIYIPKNLFVLSKVLSGAVNLVASWIALVLVMVFTGTRIYPAILLTFIPILFLILLSLGTGLFLAAMTVRFRDILHLYGVFCTGLFYLTPVIYPMSILPEQICTLVAINPLTQILEMFRMLIMTGEIPGIREMAGTMLSGVLVLIFGMVVFNSREDHFILDL